MAITKPVVGGDDDAWGEKVNASLDDLDSRVGTAVSTAASAASTASNALTKANSAEAAANSAASTAGSASSTAGSAVTAAQAAQTAAESAAARAALSASLVNAPPDTAVKALLDNPASQTATTLSNTYALRGTGGDATRFPRLQPTVLSAFQSGHGFATVSAGGGTVSDDTTDYLAGSQSLKVVTGGSGASVIVGKALAAPLPADRMLRLWFKVDAPNTLYRLRIFLASDSGFANYYTFEAQVSSASIAEDQRKWKSGEWAPVDFTWSVATATGTPNDAALQYVRILVNDRGAGPADVRLGRLDHVASDATHFPAGVVTFTYDDSWLSQYTVALPHLSKHGFTGSLFPILERLDQPGYLTSAQVDSLAFTHLWEIGAHATTYDRHVASLGGLTADDRWDELSALKAWQNERGYATFSYAYPNGTFTKAAADDLARFYAMGRMAAGATSSGTPDETEIPVLPLRLQAQNPTNLSLAQMQAEVDRAAANGIWLIFMFHDLVTAKAKANDVTIADHQALVDYVAASGAAVRTMAEVLATAT